MKILAALLSIVILTSCPVCASAAFYRYYDETGGVNVTNDLNSIPERYRSNVTVITEKELENKKKAREKQERTENGAAVRSQRQQQQVAPVQSAAPESTTAASAEQKKPASAPDKTSDGWLSRQLPLLKVAGIIAILIAGFVIAGKFVSALAPRPLAIAIKVALFAALSVYIFKGFSEKIVDAFARIKDESRAAQKAVDKRSERIQKQAE